MPRKRTGLHAEVLDLYRRCFGFDNNNGYDSLRSPILIKNPMTCGDSLVNDDGDSLVNDDGDSLVNKLSTSSDSGSACGVLCLQSTRTSLRTGPSV